MMSLPSRRSSRGRPVAPVKAGLVVTPASRGGLLARGWQRSTGLVAGAVLTSTLVAGCGGISIGIGGDDPTEESSPTDASISTEPSESETTTDETSTEETDPAETSPEEESPSSDQESPSPTDSDPATDGESDPDPTSDSDAPSESEGGPSIGPIVPTDGSDPENDPGEDTSPDDGTSPSQGESSSEADDDPSPSDDPAESPGDDGDQPADSRGRVVEEPGIPHRGEAYRWESGLVAHITTGESFVPSSAAAGIDGFSQFLLFEVTLTNRSPQEFRLSDFRIGGQSAGEQASRVFDAGNGINSLPAQDLGMGETTTFPVVFGVRDPDDTVLDVVQAFELSDRIVFLPPKD